MEISTMALYSKIKTNFAMRSNEHLLHAWIFLEVGGTNMIKIWYQH